MSDYLADVMSIETFFCGNPSGNGMNVPLRIPDLQRSFVWDEAAVRGFWEDMQDHRMAKGKIHEMFGGTIVLHTPPTKIRGGTAIRVAKLPELKQKFSDLEIQNLAVQMALVAPTAEYSKKSFIDKIDKAREPSEVIDGQQRLTILMIGAKVLEEIGDVKKCQVNIRPRLKRIYRWNRNPRLEHLGTDETTDFKNILNNHTGVTLLTTGWSNGGNGTPIKAAYEATLTYFTGFIKGSPLKKRWKGFSEFLLGDTTIVCLETTEFHQSHLVFKSLNWKGRKLRTSELFKSILFHFSALHETETNRSKVKTSWENIVRNCTSARPATDDAVSEFLHDWCRSVGIRRSKATGDPKHDSKELKLEEALTVLENMLKSQCRRGRSNTGKVRDFIKKLEDESKMYAGIWKPTSAMNSVTNQWMDLIDLRRMYSQGGLSPILLVILRQDTKTDRDHAIRILMQCTIFAVIPPAVKTLPGVIEFSFSRSDFAKETRFWIRKILAETSSAARLSKMKGQARALLEKDVLYPSANGQARAAWINDINNRWKSTMTISGIDPQSVKLLLRYIEGIDIVSGCPIALDYRANYDKDRLQAEHIFPKSAVWGTTNKSDWKKEWDLDNTRWPADEDERNGLKWHLGNYILLEKEVNNSCKVRTWKGWPKPTKAPSKVPPKFKKGQDKGKLKFEGFGKIHYYLYYQWSDEDLTGPLTASTVHQGSQLQCVADLVNTYRRTACWTKASVASRTNHLLTLAIGATCPNIDLKYLW